MPKSSTISTEILEKARRLLIEFRKIGRLKIHFKSRVWLSAHDDDAILFKETYLTTNGTKPGTPGTVYHTVKGKKRHYHVTGLSSVPAVLFGLAVARAFDDVSEETARAILEEAPVVFQIPEVKRLLKID